MIKKEKRAGGFYISQVRLSLCWCFGGKTTFNYDQSHTTSNYPTNCGEADFSTQHSQLSPVGELSYLLVSLLVGVFPSDRLRCSISSSLVLTNLPRKQLNSPLRRLLCSEEPSFLCILICTHGSEPASSREELSFRDCGLLNKEGQTENRESLRKPRSWAQLSPSFSVSSNCQSEDEVPEAKDSDHPGDLRVLFKPHILQCAPILSCSLLPFFHV